MADGKGAEGSGIPRAQIGIPHHNIHRVNIHIQLFGEQLGKRGHGALAHLYFPGIQHNAVVCSDSQKGIKIGGDSGAQKTGPLHARPGVAIKGVKSDNDTAAQHTQTL